MQVSLDGAVLDVGVQAQVHVDWLLLKTLGTEDQVERFKALCKKSKICTHNVGSFKSTSSSSKIRAKQSVWHQLTNFAII